MRSFFKDYSKLMFGYFECQAEGFEILSVGLS